MPVRLPRPAIAARDLSASRRRALERPTQFRYARPRRDRAAETRAALTRVASGKSFRPLGPRLAPRALLRRELADQVQDRQEDRQDHHADDAAHEADEERLDQAGEGLDGGLHLAVVELGDLLE